MPGAPSPSPVRSNRTPRFDGLPLPPARMPLVRDGRPLKAWRYVGIYDDELMLCAGRVRVAGVPQAFWAVWDRGAARLHERTTWSPRQVALPDGEVQIRARGVRVALKLMPFGEPVDVVSRHGSSWIWTRKTLMRATGTVALAGRVRPVDATALVDDSAGYHARATDWEWSAGVGTLADGRPVAWNLVDGVHDTTTDSERSVWVAGRPHEVGPVTFAPALDGVAFTEGGTLAFAAEAVRERHDHAGPLRSDYVQPFGTFTGTLPGAGPLAVGFGVMERHRARW
jgi:hypothetical protein